MIIAAIGIVGQLVLVIRDRMSGTIVQRHYNETAATLDKQGGIEAFLLIPLQIAHRALPSLCQPLAETLTCSLINRRSLGNTASGKAKAASLILDGGFHRERLSSVSYTFGILTINLLEGLGVASEHFLVVGLLHVAEETVERLDVALAVAGVGQELVVAKT